MPTNGQCRRGTVGLCHPRGNPHHGVLPRGHAGGERLEIALQGSDVYRVNGLIDDCPAKIIGQGKEEAGWSTSRTLKEPLPDRGQETMGG